MQVHNTDVKRVQTNITMNKPSYVGGTSDSPLIYRDIPSLLDQVAAEFPEKASHVFRLLYYI